MQLLCAASDPTLHPSPESVISIQTPYTEAHCSTRGRNTADPPVPNPLQSTASIGPAPDPILTTMLQQLNQLVSIHGTQQANKSTQSQSLIAQVAAQSDALTALTDRFDCLD